MEMSLTRNNRQKIFLVKAAHTAIFFLFSASIGYVLYSAIRGNHGWVLYLAIGAVVLEGLVLVANGWECPLTNLAKRWGDETGRVTDMFFPGWFVPHVFRTYTALFLLGIALLAVNYAVGRL